MPLPCPDPTRAHAPVRARARPHTRPRTRAHETETPGRQVTPRYSIYASCPKIEIRGYKKGGPQKVTPLVKGGPQKIKSGKIFKKGGWFWKKKGKKLGEFWYKKRQKNTP